MRTSELILQQRKVKVTQASPPVSGLFIDTDTLFSSSVRFSPAALVQVLLLCSPIILIFLHFHLTVRLRGCVVAVWVQMFLVA